MGLIIGIRTKSDILTVFFVNSLTNPPAVLIRILLDLSVPFILVLEVIIWLTEAMIYRKLLDYRKLNGFTVSLILNAVSLVIGSIAVYFVTGLIS